MGEGEVKRSRRRKTLIIILAVLAVLVIAGAGSTYYVGTNDFCGSCHQMKTRYSVWSKSTHNQVGCVTCHSEPGIIGEFKAHIDGLNYLKSFLKESTSNITIFATRRNPARLKSCIHCHPADTLIENTESIRVNHISHVIDNEILCTDCHANMVHVSYDFEMSRPKEESCIACHLIEGARTNCPSCHMKQVSKKLRHLFVLETLKELEED